MPTKITNGDVSTLQIPVVDFSAWKNASDQNARVKVAKQIVDASREVGFVYIVNHALPDALLDEAFAWSRRFFALSQEDKLKAPHPDGWAVHRGYSWPGLEKVSQAMSEGDDEERVKKLREITDCKVRTMAYWPVLQLMSTAGKLRHGQRREQTATEPVDSQRHPSRLPSVHESLLLGMLRCGVGYHACFGSRNRIGRRGSPGQETFGPQ
jgi:isopenicillin N synthase-like dioxygenase